MYNAAIVDTSIIVIGLTPGVNYDFKVDARNIVRYGPISLVMTELAA